MRWTVAVTVRNDRDNLASLLRTLAAQTRPPDELVLVDACSTDGTWEVAARHAAQAPYPVVAEQTAGPRGAGRTRCLELASGDVVAFVDSDCEVPPEWLARYVEGWAREAAREAAPLGALGGPNFTPPGSTPLQQAVDDVMGPMEASSFHGINTINCAYLRKAALAAGAFDASLHTAEDPDLNARIAKLGYRLLRLDNPCWHKRRDSWPRLVRQHFAYGQGAVALLRRHPEYFPPVERWVAPGGAAALLALGVAGALVSPWVWLAIPATLAGVPLVVHRRHAWRFLRTHGMGAATWRRLAVLWVVYVPYQAGILAARLRHS